MFASFLKRRRKEEQEISDRLDLDGSRRRANSPWFVSDSYSGWPAQSSLESFEETQADEWRGRRGARTSSYEEFSEVTWRLSLGNKLHLPVNRKIDLPEAPVIPKSYKEEKLVWEGSRGGPGFYAPTSSLKHSKVNDLPEQEEVVPRKRNILPHSGWESAPCFGTDSW